MDGANKANDRPIGSAVLRIDLFSERNSTGDRGSSQVNLQARCIVAMGKLLSNLSLSTNATGMRCGLVDDPYKVFNCYRHTSRRYFDNLDLKRGGIIHWVLERFNLFVDARCQFCPACSGHDPSECRIAWTK